MQWARSLTQRIGRRCSICEHPDMNRGVRLLCQAWADGTAPHLSWPTIAAAMRQRHNTRTVWESVRNHVERHEPELAKALRGCVR